jgi:hypothetical protein
VEALNEPLRVYSPFVANSHQFDEEQKTYPENPDCGGHIVIIVYSSYVCNTPIVVEKILQLI